MKKLIVRIGLLIFTFGVICSCSSVNSGFSKNDPLGITVAQDESIIVVKRNSTYGGAAGTHKIIVDNEILAELRSGEVTSFAVKNGSHTIYAEVSMGSISQRSNTIRFEVNSQKITFAVGYNYLGWSGLQLIQGETVMHE